jgi:hypothetical protein
MLALRIWGGLANAAIGGGAASALGKKSMRAAKTIAGVRVSISFILNFAVIDGPYLAKRASGYAKATQK